MVQSWYFFTADGFCSAGAVRRALFGRWISGIIFTAVVGKSCIFREPANSCSETASHFCRMWRIFILAAVHTRCTGQDISDGRTIVRNGNDGQPPLPIRLCHNDGSARYPLCRKGAVIRAHSFHYADSTENGTAFSVQRPNGRTWLEVQQQGSILAGFPHWYFPSCPEAAQRFAEQCRRYQKRRNNGCRF